MSTTKLEKIVFSFIPIAMVIIGVCLYISVEYDRKIVDSHIASCKEKYGQDTLYLYHKCIKVVGDP